MRKVRAWKSIIRECNAARCVYVIHIIMQVRMLFGFLRKLRVQKAFCVWKLQLQHLLTYGKSKISFVFRFCRHFSSFFLFKTIFRFSLFLLHFISCDAPIKATTLAQFLSMCVFLISSFASYYSQKIALPLSASPSFLVTLDLFVLIFNFFSLFACASFFLYSRVSFLIWYYHFCFVLHILRFSWFSFHRFALSVFCRSLPKKRTKLWMYLIKKYFFNLWLY